MTRSCFVMKRLLYSRHQDNRLLRSEIAVAEVVSTCLGIFFSSSVSGGRRIQNRNILVLPWPCNYFFSLSFVLWQTTKPCLHIIFNPALYSVSRVNLLGFFCTETSHYMFLLSHCWEFFWIFSDWVFNCFRFLSTKDYQIRCWINKFP